MSRLIDADALVKDLTEQIPMAENVQVFKDIIESQPTAYDIDKVVEQLKKVSYERFGNTGMGGEDVVNWDDAIKIIRTGDVNHE